MNAPLIFCAKREPLLRLQILEVIGRLSVVSDQIALLASMERRPSPGDAPQIQAAFEQSHESLRDAISSLQELGSDLRAMEQASAAAIRRHEEDSL